MNRYIIQIWHEHKETGAEGLTTVPVKSPTPLSDNQLDLRRNDAIAQLHEVTVVYSRIVQVPAALNLGDSYVSSN